MNRKRKKDDLYLGTMYEYDGLGSLEELIDLFTALEQKARDKGFTGIKFELRHDSDDYSSEIYAVGKRLETRAEFLARKKSRIAYEKRKVKLAATKVAEEETVRSVTEEWMP